VYLNSTFEKQMFLQSISIYILCLISIYFFGVILVEWDSSELLVVNLPGNSFIILFVLSCSVLSIMTGLIIGVTSKLYQLETVTQAIALPGGKSMPYQLWIAILFARSCHVWTHTIESQTILNVCDQVLTLGAPVLVNWTCIENCDGINTDTKHYLPFLRNDAHFLNASEACSPWFEEDTDSLIWTMKWETILFAGLLVHMVTRGILQDTKTSYLLWVDIISLISASCIAFEPHTYYSLYNVGGVLRFLGLLHAIVPLESLVNYKQLVGVTLTCKLMFIVLSSAAIMFVAEKPCKALQQECDTGFHSFGNTLYFIFVTLSTVGYGDMSPKTTMGKICIVFIIMASISYLPNLLSDVLELCRKNPIHNRLDEMHDDIRQVGFIMHGGTHKKKSSTNKKKSRLMNRLKERKYSRRPNVELERLL